MTRARTACVLALGCAVAFALRALGFETVFLDDGTVVFAIGDAQYHARLAQYSFLHFPRTLVFDPFINFPDGGYVIYPPLHDWLPAAAARLIRGDLRTLERVTAWAPVVWGTAALLPIHGLGRRLGGPAVGVGAALLFAGLPLAMLYGRVGYADHHAAVGCLGAILLLLYATVLEDGCRGARLARAFAGLAVTRAALLLVWQGSLLHLAPGELAVVATGSLRGRRDLLAGEAISALASVLLVAPVAARVGQPLGGPFSAIELSYLHASVLVAAAAVAGASASLQAWRPATGAARRWARLVLLAAGPAALLLLAPGAFEALGRALEFLGKGHVHGAANVEQVPLAPFGRPGATRLALASAGLYVFLIPLAPLVFLIRVRDPARRPAAWYLASWAAISGALALFQMRFANEFAPVGCIAFALGLRELARAAPGRARWRGAAAVLLGVALASPALVQHGAGLQRSWDHLTRPGPARDRALATAAGTLVRFAQEVRAATPESGDFVEATPPDYGILCYSGMGHTLHYYGQRATPSDNFGPYIGEARFLEAQRFFTLRSELEAVGVAKRERARFVATMDYGDPRRAMLVYFLHRADGRARSWSPRLERFRLVTEGPAGGQWLFPDRVPPQTIPYKLFEVVEGAVLEVPGPRAALVTATVVVGTPSGRHFSYVAESRVDETGFARLRVPYATEFTRPARAIGPYRVEVEGRRYEVEVSEAAVQAGDTVRVSPGHA